MTPTEPGFYWAVWPNGPIREPIVVLFGDGKVWVAGNRFSQPPSDWTFLSGPLRFEGTVPAEEKTASELA